jgi:cobyrinic acid a,c-diamide synthase
MKLPRLVIAGTHSGVGKTTATLAIMAALQARGRKVQPFKVGPDFIDPGHHALATGRPSRNLDGWMLGPEVSREIFLRAASDADLSIIEGVMGLFDGSSPVTEVGSAAEMAKVLAAPVLLVIDGSAMARSAAAMAQGYARFDPQLRVAGVLFNRISGDGHFRLLKEAVEAETELAVVGYLRPDPAVTIADRHLGLVTAIEQGSRELYETLGRLAAETLDLDGIEALARSAPSIGEELGVKSEENLPGRKPLTLHASPFTVRVGVAYDEAFCFYYPENLEMLEREGAEVIRFSPLRDAALPDVDLLYLGGGYPELHAETLSRNAAMREAVRDFAGRGGTVYAECGGLMYLTQAIRDFEGRAHEMVGLFPVEAVMRKPGLTLGYRDLEITQACPLGPVGTKARGHEFHYSYLAAPGGAPLATSTLRHACAVKDARGASRSPDGLLAGNTIALYTHLHFASQPALARALLESARTHPHETISKR